MHDNLKFSTFEYSPTLGNVSQKDITRMVVSRFARGSRQEGFRDTDIMTMALYGWHIQRKPFYRIYPGVLEALLSWDWTKYLDIPSTVSFDTVSVELPVGHEVSILEPFGQTMQVYAMLLCSFADDCNAVLLYGSINNNLCNRLLTFYDMSEVRTNTEIPPAISAIVLGILAISTNPELMRPIVLSADKDKYNQTQDQKYVERAIRRGVRGFEIGKDIPTKAEMQRMREENEAFSQAGKKCPHMRCAHLRRQMVGKGRALPKIVVVKQAFINWDIVKNVPQGYYGDE